MAATAENGGGGGKTATIGNQDGLVIGDDAQMPLALFPVPRSYQDDLSAVLIPRGLIQDRVQQLANEIHARIGDQAITMLCILKGSYRFFTDLVERLSEARSQCKSPIRVEFIRARSYSDQGSTGHLTIEGLDALENGDDDGQWGLKGTQVLLVDDIIDTGLTITRLVAELGRRVGQGGKVWTALLVSKRTNLRRADSCHGDFVAFSIPDKFVVGYGMDYNQMFRDLAHICVMNQRGIDKYKNNKQ